MITTSSHSGYHLGCLIVFLSVSTLNCLGGFSLSGILIDSEPGSEIILRRENLDSRSNRIEAKTTLDPNRSFSFIIESEAGLFKLDLPFGRTTTIATENGEKILVEAHQAKLSITGSPGTEALMRYEVFRKDSLERLVYPARSALNEAESQNAPKERLTELARQEVDGYNAHRHELNDFVIKNIDTPSALYATSIRWDGDYRRDELQEKVNTASQRHGETAIANSMTTRLEKFSKTAIGAKGAPLTGFSLKGTAKRLADLDGKVVLIDFWASWCTPCRVENRHYSELLEMYSQNGFAIFAVNLDTDRRRWEIASQRDAVTWPQISDGLGWKSPLAEAYNVSALPQSFLLDQDGKIIARNLRGPQLADTIKKLLAK